LSACFRIHLVPVYREAAEPVVVAVVVAAAVVVLPAVLAAPVVEVVRLRLRLQRIPAEFMAQAAACVFRAG
jgi:hypothetical protein